MPRVVMIAAVNGAGMLAVDGKIPWHQPRDVSHFRARTEGRWLLLGRTTFGQMEGWFRPGQVPLVLTGRADLKVPGGWAVGSVEEAVELARGQGAEELVVCGGGQVYAAALSRADEIILTEVGMDAEAMAALRGRGEEGRGGEVRGGGGTGGSNPVTYFPELDPEAWKVVEVEDWEADLENVWPMTIRRLVRVG